MTDELLFNITDTQIQEAGRWQRRALKAEALLKPRRIDDDTPDGVLVWCRSIEKWVDDYNAQHYGSKPTWWLPMPPAPEDNSDG